MGRLKAVFGKISESMRALSRKALDIFDARDFSSRDVRAIKIAAVAILLFLVFSVYKAIFLGGSVLRSEVDTLQRQLSEITALKKEYRHSKNLLLVMGGSLKEEKEALISVVERTLLRNGIERKSFSITGTNPSVRARGIESERAVLVRINEVSVPKILNVLYFFQRSETILKVSDLRIKTRFDDPSLTDVSFRLSTFSFRKSG